MRLIVVARWVTMVVAAALFIAWPAHAAEPNAMFQQASVALEKGEYQRAIDTLEALADHGFSHPDASFDRGLAYVMRVRAKAGQPGDLGRAAAGFEEALALRPDDHAAEAALDTVRAEITRRRSRRAQDSIDERPTLDRVVVRLASERTWSVLALGSSLLLALGLVLRRRAERPAHVTGSVLAPAAALALAAFAPLTYAARHLDETTRVGVVVAPEIHLTSASGRALGVAVIPEGASVETTVAEGELVHVRWGKTEGYAPRSAVRILQQPPSS